MTRTCAHGARTTPVRVVLAACASDRVARRVLCGAAMKKIIKPKTPLVLSIESLRRLDDTKLVQIAGGQQQSDRCIIRQR